MNYFLYTYFNINLKIFHRSITGNDIKELSWSLSIKKKKKKKKLNKKKKKILKKFKN